MTPSLAPDRLLRRLPAYVVNGVSVALGIGAVHLVFGLIGGSAAAQIAGSGAVCASLADLPNTAGRTRERVFAAAALASCAALLVALLRTHPIGIGFGTMAVAFTSMMTLAWGPRAGPVSFAPILALVFALAVPPGAQPTLALVGWNIAGAAAYIGWSLATSTLLQRRYRRLALVAAMHSAANLLRSRSGLLQAQAAAGDSSALGRWVAVEGELAERLQAARDLLFAAPDASKSRRGTAILLRTIDLRDVLLASRLDLDLLGDDTVSRLVLERLGNGLRLIAAHLDALADALRDRAPPPDGAAIDTDPDVLFAGVEIAADDSRVRALPAIAARLQHLVDNVGAIRKLLGGDDEDMPLTHDELQRFVAPQAWPVAALRAQLSGRSPVLRHAVRMSLALGSAYFLARALPWASHPHWLVLSVAVVLRGNLEQTLTRRNARVLGTLFGCILVVALFGSRSPSFTEAVFLVSVGIAHSFINVRYWVTATAATVMALLQAHLADPGVGFALGERLADTVLGAALGWAFSYVLPSWERQSVPDAVAHALAALDGYARRVLSPASDDAVELRLARRNAYDALGAVAAAMQRSTVEPKRARLPVTELAVFLDHGQRLMAHLSSVRLILVRRAAALPEPEVGIALRAAMTELSEHLAPVPDAAPATADARELWPDTIPEDPPTADPLPWLLRRLQLSVDAARRVEVAVGAIDARLR